MSKAKEIRTKIVSVKNMQKITRAMQLVSASKIRKAQDRMIMSRPYASKIRKVISHVAASHAEYPHPYLQQRENIRRRGYIVITTNRGLCGGLNVNLFRTVVADMKQRKANHIDDLCIIGRKGEDFFRHYGRPVLAVVDYLGDMPAVQDVIGIVKVMLDQYNKEKIDAIYIATNKFCNTMIQKPIVRQLLPLQADQKKSEEGYWDYIYEPDSPKDLLEILLVRYIESQVYQAVIENIACEQSARMIAMKNATENASQLIDELQLIYNKARQAGITREISEIIAGASAVE
ncbi:F0F1 ATP synthase subunit gamma [Coxiella endosymbiont of Amblyomma nuttalli]|uniref:F0F1 ATP synthase subunit gamma n=1 Tax=Coxiella endosymbiont of Amblyomma nuttalli TaxID=2749996 RepID=UPI001BA62F91|nr:F0F1 ATP synthase subunit gamma [Coxiella endosymbiont of Amblyomma nuttalli]QTS84229.1 ATP synthase gamma chain [Coxiella endosymbiont of Amblyomma nuttalli]